MVRLDSGWSKHSHIKRGKNHEQPTHHALYILYECSFEKHWTTFHHMQRRKKEEEKTLYNKALHQRHVFSLFHITVHSRKQLPPIHCQTFLHPSIPLLVVSTSSSLAVACFVYLPACWLYVQLAVGMNGCRYCGLNTGDPKSVAFVCVFVVKFRIESHQLKLFSVYH